MKQNQFVHKNTDKWQQFELLCEQKEANLPVNFSKLYRTICCDLAIARTRHYSPALLDKLNELGSQDYSIYE